MKKYILFSIFAVSGLIFTSCSDNSLIDSIDEKEILDPNFSYIQVYVYNTDNSAQNSQSNSNGQSCGNSGNCSTQTANLDMVDVEVSLYADLVNMTNDTGPEISINTNSRGVARFDYLENSSYYVYVKSVNSEKTLFIQTKKGELVRTSVAF